MKRSNKFVTGLTLIALSLTSIPALAHTGATVEASLLSGFLHPFTGFDHLLAMLAVGFWAAQQTGQKTLAIPATFIITLILGFSIALSGITLPGVESGIATSVLILGFLIISATQLSATASLPLIAIFALFHGFAHGAELGAASAGLFAIGFIAASALLHITGVASSHSITRMMPVAHKLIGGFLSVSGAIFLLS